MRRFIVNFVPILALVAAPALARAQTREVTGTVTQQISNQPLTDAIVTILGQPAGTRTNEKGQYRITVPSGNVTLLVRAIGYKRQTKAVPAGDATANFTLERDVLELETVTITGAATTVERKNAATAVAAVNSEELTRVAAPSIESALQAKVPGASINMNNGAPGGGGQIQIRGASSLIGRIDPLFVVDGVIISNAVRSNEMSVITGSLNRGEENGTNRLADLNPNDIESIEVLKSAAASAIYGSQATNGVIIITTKRGRAGTPRFDITQRVGTSQLIRNKGSRKFKSADDVLSVIGKNQEGIAAAKAACGSGACPYFDYIGELYGRTDPSYETVATLTGGVNNTRYLFSGMNKQEAGTAMGTSALRQSLRANLDQSLGSRITVSLSSGIMRSFSQRGISNNDNALSSPLYAFAYTPSVLDLRKRDEKGQYVLNPFAGGGTMGGSNPFQTFALMKNDEDVYRLMVSANTNYNAYTSAKHVVNFNVIAGADRFSNENYLYAPQDLQFQREGTTQGGTFPGAVIQGNGTQKLSNATGSAVWSYTPAGFLSAKTAVGLQYEERFGNDYNLIGRGLGPQQQIVAGAQNIDVTNNKQLVRNQAWYAQEDLLLFGERLFLSGAVRGERSSVNGDPNQLYYFPRGSASYRFIAPVRGVNELKLRASYGASGMQANYGERSLVLADYGIIGGEKGYGNPSTIGNSTVKPERLNEFETGIDLSMLNERVRLEGTFYDRRITDLLVRPQIAPSTGINGTVVNGGEMSTKGYEVGVTAVPIQTRDLMWTSRATWYQNRADITKFPPGVQPFTTGTAAGGFGNAYGRLRFEPGHTVTTIWGNKIIDGKVKGNQPLADANPRYLMSFANDISWRSFNVNVLIDHRHGGSVSNMTLNLYDEGGNTWDYDKPSPDPKVGATLGEYRYNKWADGQTAVYLMDGSYTKIREVNVSYDVPRRLYSRFPGVQNARLSLSGRNLFIISAYNGFDPEVNNGGNFVARFVDLAPFPPSRTVLMSLSLGF